MDGRQYLDEGWLSEERIAGLVNLVEPTALASDDPGGLFDVYIQELREGDVARGVVPGPVEL